MSAVAPLQTTLGADLSRVSNIVNVASNTGIAAGHAVVVGAEVLRVQEVIGTTFLRVQRGQFGSGARAHDNGSKVYFGAADKFIYRGGRAIVSGGTDSELPDFTLPVGSRVVDPNTGYEYVVVDCQTSFNAGEWVVIDGNGNASLCLSTSKGRVGIIVEAIGASDTLALALVVGVYSAALFTSGVTTACALLAVSGAGDISTSTGGNVIFGASCTAAPSTATSPATGGGVGTAYVNNPWVYGMTVDIVP